MPIYYFLHDAKFFHHDFVPALTESWRRRSFEPCRSLCVRLIPAVAAFAARSWAIAEEPLVQLVTKGLRFDRHFWSQLVGEIMLYGAADIPELDSDVQTLCELIESGSLQSAFSTRNDFRPIEQAHFGSRDLVFASKTYRPERAGYNDTDDVARLDRYLNQVDTSRWQPDLVSKPGVQEEEIEDEIEFARQSLSGLQDLYRGACARGQLILHEIL
jgi:hypothetical protein